MLKYIVQINTVALVLLSCFVLLLFPADAQDLERIARENTPAVLVLMGYDDASGREIQGSAFCIDTAGWVLSTAHQVVGMSRLEGRFADESSVTLKAVLIDEERDLALLQSEEPLPRALCIGDASRLRIGAPLTSIAAPKQLEFTLSRGIVSNLSRTYRGFQVIQTDLGAAPGSSGGPVFDRNGEAVGMILMHLEDEAWVTFINPINNAFDLLKQAGLNIEELRSAFIATTQPLTIGLQEELLIPVHDISDIERNAIQAYNRGVLSEKLEDKIQAYSLARSLLPDFYEAVFNLAVVLQQQGEHEAAEQVYLQAQRIRPNAPESYRNLGRLYLRQGRYQAAVETFLIVSNNFPDSPQSFNDLGEAYRRLGALEDASDAFREAIRLESEYPMAHYNLGLVLVEMEDFENAKFHLSYFLRLRPESDEASQVQLWLDQL